MVLYCKIKSKNENLRFSPKLFIFHFSLFRYNVVIICTYEVFMDYSFQWDSKKAKSNLTKHSVSFETATTVFIDKLAISIYDEEHSNYEDRWITLVWI